MFSLLCLEFYLFLVFVFTVKHLVIFLFKSCCIKEIVLLLNVGFYFYLPPMCMHCACVRGDALSVVCVPAKKKTLIIDKRNKLMNHFQTTIIVSFSRLNETEIANETTMYYFTC